MLYFSDFSGKQMLYFPISLVNKYFIFSDYSGEQFLYFPIFLVSKCFIFSDYSGEQIINLPIELQSEYISVHTTFLRFSTKRNFF